MSDWVDLPVSSGLSQRATKCRRALSQVTSSAGVTPVCGPPLAADFAREGNAAMRCAAAVAVAAAVPSSSYSAGTNRMVFRPDTRATLYSGARRSLRALEVSASKVAVGALREEGDDDGASWPVESGVQYKRIMLKVSGEALQGKMGFGVDPQVLRKVAMEIAQAHLAGVEVAVVVGGGNFFRGAAAAGDFLDRATGDYVGMLATCMNAIMLQSALEREFAVPSRVMTAIEMKEVAEPYIRRRAIRHLERGRVVIFGAGTGNPFFTTDTAAALRAVEIGAEVFMKATKVDGVYDCDPKSNPGASLFKRVSYGEVMSRGLNVMDATAITLCRENDIPVLVFNLYTESNVIRAARGEDVGTLVSSDCEPGIKSKGKLQGPGPAAGAPVA